LGKAFARAGGEQARYGEIACKALDACIEEYGSYEELLKQEDAPDIVWRRFVEGCKPKGVNERLNKGVVIGLVGLAKRSHEESANLLLFFRSKIEKYVPDAFILLRKIKGIGDKIAAFILRDVVTVLSLEEKIPRQHQVFLQPVDR